MYASSSNTFVHFITYLFSKIVFVRRSNELGAARWAQWLNDCNFSYSWLPADVLRSLCHAYYNHRTIDVFSVRLFIFLDIFSFVTDISMCNRYGGLFGIWRQVMFKLLISRKRFETPFGPHLTYQKVLEVDIQSARTCTFDACLECLSGGTKCVPKSYTPTKCSKAVCVKE